MGLRMGEVFAPRVVFSVPEGDILEAPEQEGGFVDELIFFRPELAQPVGGSDDVSRKGGVGVALKRRGLGAAVVVHDRFGHDGSVADGFGQNHVHEDVQTADEEPADTTGHHGTESNEVGIPGDGPGPGVGDDEPPDPPRAAGGIESNRPAPIGEKEGDVLKAELIHETVKILRMGAGMVVLVNAAAQRRDRVPRCPGRQRQRQGVDGRRAAAHDRPAAGEAGEKQRLHRLDPLREQVRAQIRVMVKKILREYGYPPDLQQAATELVIEQAKVLCNGWSMA